MSVTAEGTSNRTSSPVGMTISTMARLHIDYAGKDVFIDNRCPFQMAGYPYHQFVQWPDND